MTVISKTYDRLLDRAAELAEMYPNYLTLDADTAIDRYETIDRYGRSYSDGSGVRFLTDTISFRLLDRYGAGLQVIATRSYWTDGRPGRWSHVVFQRYTTQPPEWRPVREAHWILETIERFAASELGAR